MSVVFFSPAIIYHGKDNAEALTAFCDDPRTPADVARVVRERIATWHMLPAKPGENCRFIANVKPDVETSYTVIGLEVKLTHGWGSREQVGVEYRWQQAM